MCSLGRPGNFSLGVSGSSDLQLSTCQSQDLSLKGEGRFVGFRFCGKVKVSANVNGICLGFKTLEFNRPHFRSLGTDHQLV